MAVDTPALEAREVLRQHGRSFHFAGRFLGEAHAMRAARLYAFCRHVDDLADEAPNPQAARHALDRLRRDLARGDSASPEVRDLIELADETHMPLAWPAILVDGVSRDLDPVALADERDLVLYAYRVAGVVGLMMCAVLGTRDRRAYPFAVDLGLAMQMTNIARDVLEDARMDRRYLPGSWIGGATAGALAAPDAALKARIEDAVARLLALSERYYRSAEHGMGHLPPRARFAILVAGRVYREIGCKLARNGYRAWAGRTRVSGTRKALIALAAAGDFGVRRHLHRRDAVHDPWLHVWLAGHDGADPQAEAVGGRQP